MIMFIIDYSANDLVINPFVVCFIKCQNYCFNVSVLEHPTIFSFNLYKTELKIVTLEEWEKALILNFSLKLLKWLKDNEN